jgi:hypothetical protein
MLLVLLDARNIPTPTKLAESEVNPHAETTWQLSSDHPM